VVAPGNEAREGPLDQVGRPSRVRRRQLRARRRRALLLAVTLVVAAGAVVLARGVSHARRPAEAAAAQGATSPAPRPATTTTLPPPYQPPPVTPLLSPALAGEGQWVPADTWDQGPASVMTTTFRPDPSAPNVVAYAAWIRTTTTQLALYPGYEGPGPSALDRGPEMVPQSAWPNLLAAFNSGFYEADAAAGFFVHGTLYFPMVNGMATVVARTDGQVDIVDWEGGPTPGPDVVLARQNLPLLVDGGAVTPAASAPQWGPTLGGVPAVWRSGLGIDAQGNLVYVAAPAQTALSLARVLVDVGAVRGMELDINPEWPIFTTYGGPGAVSPSLFVPNPNQVPNRFLYSSTKDFFAVFVRQPGVTEQPW